MLLVVTVLLLARVLGLGFRGLGVLSGPCLFCCGFFFFRPLRKSPKAAPSKKFMDIEANGNGAVRPATGVLKPSFFVAGAAGFVVSK